MLFPFIDLDSILNKLKFIIYQKFFPLSGANACFEASSQWREWVEKVKQREREKERRNYRRNNMKTNKLPQMSQLHSIL